MARVPILVITADPDTGEALGGVSAEVLDRTTSTPLTLYAGEVGAGEVDNPLVTDAYGRAQAWLEEATPLQIDYSGPGLTPWTEYRNASDWLDLVGAAGGGIASGAAFPADPADPTYFHRTDLGRLFRYTDAGGWEELPRMGAQTVPSARVTRAANYSLASDVETALPFTVETEDTDGMVDLGAQPTRVTIKTPGRYLVTAAVDYASSASGGRQVQIRVNGVKVAATRRDGDASEVAGTALDVSRVLRLAAGDYVELFAYQNITGGGNLDAVARDGSPELAVTWLGGAGQTVDERGAPACRLGHSAAQAIPNNVSTPVTFNTERHDTDGMHDTAVNPSRITIKTPGIYSLKAGGQFAAHATGFRVLSIRKNGATVLSEVQQDGDTGDQNALTLGVPATDVLLAAGDYVELFAYQNSGGALNLTGGVEESPFLSASLVATGKTVTPFCRLRRSANTASQIWNGPVLTFDVELADNDGMHDNAVNPSRITARTAGIYHITGIVGYDANASPKWVDIRKNGATIVASVNADPVDSGSTRMHVNATLELAVGDYVELVPASATAVVIFGGNEYDSTFSAVKIGGPNGASADVEPLEGWQTLNASGGAEPAFRNAWTNDNVGTFGSAGFRKDRGKVTMRGLVNTGSAATAIITQLPVGYRPLTRRRFPCYHGSPSAGATPYVEVDVTGDVYFGGVAAVAAGSLDAVSFYVD